MKPAILYILAYIWIMANNNASRLNYSNGLMFGSLLLLLAFLVFWNIENYKREKTDLQRQLMMQGELAEADIQKDVLWKIVKKYSNLSDTITIVEELENFPIDFNERKNSIRKTLSGNTYEFIESKDSMSVTFFNSDFPVKIEKDSIPRWEKKDGKFNITTDETNLSSNDLDFFLSLEANSGFAEAFQNRLDSAQLPKEFEMTLSSTAEEMPIGLFVEVANQRQTAVFKNYKGHIFKKIWPALLATIGLFLLVSLAFYSVHRSRRQQLQLNKIKSEFVSNMTHELKTPISTVSVALEAIRDFGAMDDPERMKEYLDISNLELNRLNLIVDKVLKMSAFDKGIAKLNIEKIDLLTLVNDILKTMKLHFEKQAVQLNFEVKGSNFEMKGDRIHLTNVIYNLLDNAMKYSPENPKIDIVLEAAGDHFNFSVRDQGIGIPQDYVDKIFNPFFRVPNEDKHDVKGHGLGLSYVKQIIEKHGGKIAVSSERQLGSQFNISLPNQLTHA